MSLAAKLGDIEHSQLRSGRAVITDGASTSVIAAGGAGARLCVTSVVISNSSATAAEVDIRDGAAGAVLATYPAPANKLGAVHALPTPLLFSDNTAACADPDAALTSIKVTLIGYAV